MPKETLSTRLATVEGTLKAVVANLGEINTTLKLANGGTTKPRRVEIMLAIMGILVAAQTLGFVDGIRDAIKVWLNGST